MISQTFNWIEIWRDGGPGCHDKNVGIDENVCGDGPVMGCLNGPVSRSVIMHKNDSWSTLFKGREHVAVKSQWIDLPSDCH